MGAPLALSCMDDHCNKPAKEERIREKPSDWPVVLMYFE